MICVILLLCPMLFFWIKFTLTFFLLSLWIKKVKMFFFLHLLHVCTISPTLSAVSVGSDCGPGVTCQPLNACRVVNTDYLRASSLIVFPPFRPRASACLHCGPSRDCRAAPHRTAAAHCNATDCNRTDCNTFTQTPRVHHALARAVDRPWVTHHKEKTTNK